MINSEEDDDEASNDFRCYWKDCGNLYEGQAALVAHVNSDHIQKSKKDCTCYWKGCAREEKPFKAMYMLVVHVRRHTGEKPHACDVSYFHQSSSIVLIIFNHLLSLLMTFDHRISLSIIVDLHRLSQIINDHLLLRMIFDHHRYYRSLSIVINCHRSLLIIVYHYGLLTIITNHYHSSSIIIDCNCILGINDSLLSLFKNSCVVNFTYGEAILFDVIPSRASHFHK